MANNHTVSAQTELTDTNRVLSCPGNVGLYETNFSNPSSASRVLDPLKI